MSVKVWITVHNLFMHPACRARLDLELQSMRSQLCRLRAKITEQTAEQLPFLKGLAFFLDQIACAYESARPAAAIRPKPVKEQVCTSLSIAEQADLLCMGNIAAITDEDGHA